ncbi:diaminopimelate epimerase [Kordia sp. YSTF-M3]|uniref:Diaminopimelate epimerase n=1 Tax=Kordia aestuariivivens TaxID=2759037 RepID=A0ABR7QCL9_9FLAO|nr:diaminopimelate epimerase [Kordia aestuariivivens]MBC8756111.1 diaminopimelate epimerase [Kordia aestuariivivens]
MIQSFYKYQGTGNDFVLIDNRQLQFSKNDTKLVNHLCDRKFGIGADGLILLEHDAEYDFKMVYYNADGNESTMCGNGGRCIVAFANFLGVIKNETTFRAIDGKHYATIDGDVVNLQMQDVSSIEQHDGYVFLDTGSPHHVVFKEEINQFNIQKEGAAIRYGAPYFEEGTNVNFVKKLSDTEFRVRTYERGVEDETLSCGTGVTAVALAMHHLHETTANKVTLQVEGGALQVSFERDATSYKNIFLKGKATQVFKGEISC